LPFTANRAQQPTVAAHYFALNGMKNRGVKPMQTYPTGYAESHRMAEQIFREILPRRGMAVREEQIALCHEVLDTLYNKEISLCEAGVGIGKTLAYLVACILWQMHRPSQLKMPVAISTSSVALQDAILNEYLPDLSAVLLAEGIITAPITAVVRKGKERFVCDARLAERQAKAISKGSRQKGSLRMAENVLDLDHIPGLSRYDRCRICVPQSCPRDCFLRLDCRYQQYLRDSMKPDIQICNHNYLLANASHRLEERPLLLRQYQALVVDEAHKLPDAARQMYTETLSAQDMDELCFLLQQTHFKSLSKRLRTVFLTLSISCAPSFAMPKRKISIPFDLTPFRQAAIADCINLLQYIGSQPDMPHYLQYRLAEAESLLRLFLLDVPMRILYLEFSADGQLTFCAASNRVPQLLRSALWNTREPTILTSGTLTAAGDFDHTEQLLGLAAYAPLRHFRAESPFNYRKKCLLYIPARRAAAVSENQYLADQIVRLTAACHGHALVLFTSYRQMRNVYDALGGRLTFPVFQAGRGQNRSIQQFRQSGNGVLFAAGSCWEGIDFPGDMVSLLIIAKLPFPIPDPVSDYERQQYPNLRDYINAEVIPEMQKKLRQGFGRAIRTEQDSCVVAILDERAGIGGKYHDAALAALPSCPTTEKIEDVQQFIREQKRPDYFL
jgi:ATP-dependent DNA helicase DinG